MQSNILNQVMNDDWANKLFGWQLNHLLNKLL